MNSFAGCSHGAERKAAAAFLMFNLLPEFTKLFPTVSNPAYDIACLGQHPEMTLLESVQETAQSLAG